MSGWSLKLMGTDVRAGTTTEVDYSVVTATTGYTNTDVKIIYGHPEPEIIEREKFESIDGYLNNNASEFRGKYSIKIAGKQFPTSNTTITGYFPELAILKKPFIYLYSDTYPFLKNINDHCFQVVFMGFSVEHSDDKNKKYLILNFSTPETI